MQFSGMYCRVGLVRSDVSEERRLHNQPTFNYSSRLEFDKLKMQATCSTETSVLTGITRRHIPEGDILHRHRREDLKSYGQFC
jgi:hypothetical protein